MISHISYVSHILPCFLIFYHDFHILPCFLIFYHDFPYFTMFSHVFRLFFMFPSLRRAAQRTWGDSRRCVWLQITYKATAFLLGWLTHSLTHSLTDSLTDLLTDCLAGWLSCSLTHWLTDACRSASPLSLIEITVDMQKICVPATIVAALSQCANVFRWFLELTW